MTIMDACPESQGYTVALQPDCTLRVIDLSTIQLEETDTRVVRSDVGATICAGFEDIAVRIISQIDTAYEQIGVHSRPKPREAFVEAARAILGDYVLGAIAQGATACSPWAFLAQQVAGTVHDILTDDWDDDVPTYEG